MTSIIKVDTLQKANGGTPTAADLGINVTGTVLQVANKSVNGRNSISSGSFAYTGFYHSITPTSTSSKILILMETGLNTQSSGNNGQMTIYRDSTELSGQTHGLAYVLGNSSRIQIPVHLSYVDTPNTTSEVTYKLYAKSDGASNIEVPVTGSEITTITLMEIAG